MAVLADYRSDVSNLLATAVDTSTWPTTLLDEALRRGLDELNQLLVYETSFTVDTAGYEQDLSSLTDIYAVLAVAYPWQDGWDFGRCLATWRLVGPNQIYFTAAQPAAGETIRVRYSKRHKIEDLDSAAATTVPDAQRVLVGLWAAAFACMMRQRQISENPALPKDAGRQLAGVAACFRQRAQEAISHIPPLGRLRWGNVGLE
jgi:hypothetical protein